MLIHSKKCLLTIAITILFVACKEGAQEKKEEVNIHVPNIILIVADDMGWHDLGMYGNDFIETPNLDKLASTGLFFTNAYAPAPLCSASRASIITGKHPISVNITEHIHGNQPARSDQKLKTPFIDQALKLEYTTLPEVLKKQGYHTAHIGKWHLGGGKFAPQHQGYDLNIAGGYNGLPESFFYPFFKSGEKPEIQDSSSEGDYLTDVLTKKAMKYISSQKDSLFFLSLNYYSPHVPIEAQDYLVTKYKEKRGMDQDSILPNVHYAAMISSIDGNVGKIVEKLEELNLRKNTIIVFSSDNGGLSVKAPPAFIKHTPPTDNGPLRAGKGYAYEGGIREPLIINWPALITENRTIDIPVIGTDIFHTLVEIGGAKTDVVEGSSWLPIIKGENYVPKGLLWHLPHYNHQGEIPVSAYRKGDWKIIHYYEDDKYELYNIKNDIGESTDLSSKNPEKLEELKTTMRQKLDGLGAKYPEPNPDYKAKS